MKKFQEKNPGKIIPRTSEQVERDFEFYYETKRDIQQRSSNANISQTQLTINEFYREKNKSPTINLTKYTLYSKYPQKVSF